MNLRSQPDDHVVVVAAEELVIAVAAEQVSRPVPPISESFPAHAESPKGGRLNCDTRSASIFVTAVLN